MFILKKKLRAYLNTIKEENRKEKLGSDYTNLTEAQQEKNLYNQGYEDGVDNFYNGIYSKFKLWSKEDPEWRKGKGKESGMFISKKKLKAYMNMIMEENKHWEKLVVEYDNITEEQKTKNTYCEGYSCGTYTVYDKLCSRFKLYEHNDPYLGIGLLL